jgi:hypothetical protein
MGELALAVLVAGAWVFGASAAAKLRGQRAYRAFAAGLRETGLVPGAARPAVAAALAGSEAVTAVGLVAAAAVAAAEPGDVVIPYAETALALAAALTAVLAAGVGVAIRRGTQARCACFGARPGRPLGRPHLVRNLILLAAFVTGLTVVPLAGGPGGPAATALAAAAGSLAALLLIRWEDLADLFTPVQAPRRTPG